MIPTRSQKARILTILQERGQLGLTALESLQLVGTMRLAAYVKFLRDDGYSIRTETIVIPSGKHVARYSLSPPDSPGLLCENCIDPTGNVIDKLAKHSVIDHYWKVAGNEVQYKGAR